MQSRMKFLYSLFYFVLLLFLLIASSGCDSILPDDYKTEEFQVSTVDKNAGDIMTPYLTSTDSIIIISNSAFTMQRIGPGGSENIFSITDNVTPVNYLISSDFKISLIQFGAIDSASPITRRSFSNASNSIYALYYSSIDTVYSRLLANVVDSTTRANSTDNQIIVSKFSQLLDTLKPMLFEKLMFLRYPDSQKVSYAKFSVTQPRDVYVYISLFNNPYNLIHFVNMDFIKSDSSRAPSSLNVSLGTAASATDTVVLETGVRTIPRIRSRSLVHLDTGNYIVRFEISDPAQLMGSDGDIPKSEFKILISSK